MRHAHTVLGAMNLGRRKIRRICGGSNGFHVFYKEATSILAQFVRFFLIIPPRSAASLDSDEAKHSGSFFLSFRLLICVVIMAPFLFPPRSAASLASSAAEELLGSLITEPDHGIAPAPG